MKNFSEQFEIIYKKFSELASAQGLQNSKLAFSRFLGVSQGRMQNWENGAIPRPDDLQAIHDKLGFSYSWLLTGEGNPFGEAENPSAAIVQDLQNDVAELKARVAELEGELAEADRVNRKLTARLLAGDTDQGVGDDGVANAG